MQMEFLLLREVQLVTPAAPTPAIYCLKAKVACTSLNTIEPCYEAGGWDKQGTAVKWPLQWPHTHTIAASFSLHSITFFILFYFPSSLHSYSLPHSCLLLLAYIASTRAHTHNYTNTSLGGHSTPCSIVSDSLVRPGSLIKAQNEAACIKHEAPRAAVMNCCSIIASQSRKMKTKYLKRDSVTSLQTQH